MIHLTYPPEPADLASARADELARMRPLAVHHGDRIPSRHFGSRYRERAFQQELLRAQHRKCCYCEQHIARSFNDVEHFRPKSQAIRGDGLPDYGYWWLAWTWDNLMYACPGCNRSHKNAAFPLTSGSAVLVPEESPPGGERPLLLNPRYEAQPWRHIRFRPFRSLGWVPVPRNGSRRGAKTIEVLGLARGELLDFYNAHVEDYLQDAIGAIQEAVEQGDSATIQRVWNQRTRPWLHPARAFVALSYDVFEHHFPRMVRRGWDLELIEPP